MEDLNAVQSAEAPQQVSNDLREIDVNKLPSPVLARLIEEVRNEEPSGIDAYSRFHNRHNRSR
ncbi:MAG: YhhA family cyclophane-containing RiPP [Acidobacteriota bacterium]